MYLTNEGTSLNMFRDVTLDVIGEYFTEPHKARMSSSGGEAVGFIRTKYAPPNDNRPDIQMFHLALLPTLDYGTFWKSLQHVKPEAWDQVSVDNCEEILQIVNTLLDLEAAY